MSSESDTETASTVRSEVEYKDWMEIDESEFVDYVEGITSFGLVFEHPEIGLHGVKFDKAAGVLQPVSFSKQDNEQ